MENEEKNIMYVCDKIRSGELYPINLYKYRITCNCKDTELGVFNDKREDLEKEFDVCPICKGKYIAILDGDDISHTTRLARQFNYLEENPHIFLVGSSAIIIDEKGKEIRRFKKYNDYKMLAWRLPKSCGIVHSSIMFRKCRLLYDPYFQSASEYKFYLDLLEEGKNLTNLPKFLVKYRVHKGGMSIYNKKEQEILTKEIKEQADYVREFKLRFLFKLFIHYLKTFREKRENDRSIKN